MREAVESPLVPASPRYSPNGYGQIQRICLHHCSSKPVCWCDRGGATRRDLAGRPTSSLAEIHVGRAVAFSGHGDHVHEGADLFDLDLSHVAGAQEALGELPCTAGPPGGEDVTGLQRLIARQVADQFGIEWSRLPDRSSCRSSPFTQVRLRRSSGWVNSSTVTQTGPEGFEGIETLRDADGGDEISGVGTPLDITRSDIIEHRQTGRTSPCVGVRSDVLDGVTEHHRDLTFEVDMWRPPQAARWAYAGRSPPILR